MNFSKNSKDLHVATVILSGSINGRERALRGDLKMRTMQFKKRAPG